MNQYQYKPVVFAAVSTKSQVGEGDAKRFSIPNQLEECRAVLTRMGLREVHAPLVVAGHSREYITLREAERDLPEIAQMITLAETKMIDLVVLYHYNRWRSLIEQIVQTLGVYGCQTYSVTQPVELMSPATFTPYTNDMAAYVVSMSATQSRLQINDLQRKFKIGMPRRVTERGLAYRAAPFGYTRPKVDDVRQLKMAVLIQVPEICKIIVEMKNRYLSGDSAGEIARDLNRRGVKPAHSNKWSVESVLYILTNPFYAGLVHHGKQKTFRDPRTGKPKRVKAEQVIAEGKHIPIWDKDTMYRLIDRRRNIGSKQLGKTRFPHLFSRLVICQCGNKCRAQRDPLDHESCRYICDDPQCRQHARILDGELFTQLRDYLKRLALTVPPPEEDSAKTRERSANMRQLTELDNKKVRYQRTYGDGVISYEDLAARLGEVESQRQKLLEKISKLDSEDKSVIKYAEQIENVKDILEAYDNLPLLPVHKANSILTDTIASITVDRNMITAVKILL